MNYPVTNEKTAGTKKSFTPRQLVKRHIENPDEPITEEDILNLDLTIRFTKEEKKEMNETADELAKDNTGMAYNAVQN